MNIRVAALGILASAFLIWGPLFKPSMAAMEPGSAQNPTSPLPGDANTPTHASNTTDDNYVTTQIRTAIQADSSLSDEAKSVSVATNQQAVILRGSVGNETDKDRVESLAGQYAGTRQVDSQITIRDSETGTPGHHLPAASGARAH